MSNNLILHYNINIHNVTAHAHLGSWCVYLPAYVQFLTNTKFFIAWFCLLKHDTVTLGQIYTTASWGKHSKVVKLESRKHGKHKTCRAESVGMSLLKICFLCVYQIWDNFMKRDILPLTAELKFEPEIL